MSIRTIRDSESLDSIWEELIFTEARLSGDAKGKSFAPAIADLIARLETVRSGQLDSWRKEVTAQAEVDAMDDQLDDFVHALDLALQSATQQNTQSPRYKRYFSEPPSSIIRLGLETEINRVRPWADSLATEAEPTLQQLGARLKEIAANSDAALERRRKSATTRTDHRVRAITTLVDDINGARRSIYGSLVRIAAEQQLPADWPNRFFRRSSRSAKAQPEIGPTPARS